MLKKQFAPKMFSARFIIFKKRVKVNLFEYIHLHSAFKSVILNFG